ncbi:MAG: hypothetical protein AUG85_05355 [Gemmatimonadetes bacterium 13_1_20CM_4_66_11]|nr:MAG: hypothetical protein AUI86_11835 [Gemmatimonadetes bacterium 13_1_40CM_3_66_12]OLD88129.1 MAG: hypothetical protein AUG85_05355 [Gemmatimonadetes bacterium 13_1_20CM_4_66_11]
MMGKSQMLREAIERELHSMDASRATIVGLVKEWVSQSVLDHDVPAKEFLQRSLQGTTMEAFLLISEMCTKATQAAMDAIREERT